ncbi:Glycosyltransferase involved in cell wall bisynthesis [Microbacterium azadirachtae]|nr:Glycosyltransferase involved in cell wall bisynthesis [Microbacterium azadirachtae]SEG57272.1 Glycosyltransferase involved in cell wall bisynthesis [Microbacterium azadirachtae]SEG60223.1 Glycosyltransferase involved in cell wall bisynthesis [Microbacterium azadirachtae]
MTSTAPRPRVMIVVTAAVTARLFMRGYAEFLAASNYDVTLVADDVSEISDALAQRGVLSYSLPMRRDPSPVHDARSLARMIALMRKVRPDAVIYATPKASLLASIASRFLRIPVRVYELWGIRFETSTGVSRRVFQGLERLIASNSTAIVANSESLAARAVKLRIARTGRICVPASGSSHGVDSEHFSPDAPRPELDADTARFLERNAGATIGFIGRLHPDKGIETLLEAASLVHDEGTEMRVLLVGGDEGLQIQGEQGRLPVHRAGDADDVRPYLAEFDVLVLMSRREGFPNVVLEAAAMEVPAIVSDATGCVDAVVPDVTGLMVPVGDVLGVADALRTVITDRNRARAMGIAARRRAVEAYAPGVVWSALEEHLHVQLGQARHRNDPHG